MVGVTAGFIFAQLFLLTGTSNTHWGPAFHLCAAAPFLLVTAGYALRDARRVLRDGLVEEGQAAAPTRRGGGSGGSGGGGGGGSKRSRGTHTSRAGSSGRRAVAAQRSARSVRSGRSVLPV